MQIIDVILYRDGGTITIIIDDDPKAGAYTLPTPFQPEPRPIYWKKGETADHQYENGEKLGIGSKAEAEFLAKLKEWWEGNINDELRDNLEYLGDLSDWRNLPDSLDEAISLYRIQTVIDYLKNRI